MLEWVNYYFTDTWDITNALYFTPGPIYKTYVRCPLFEKMSLLYIPLIIKGRIYVLLRFTFCLLIGKESNAFGDFTRPIDWTLGSNKMVFGSRSDCLSFCDQDMFGIGNSGGQNMNFRSLVGHKRSQMLREIYIQYLPLKMGCSGDYYKIGSKKCFFCYRQF